MDWRDILKNAVATTSLANIQVDDDYSDLEEDYNEDCKKRLRHFLEKVEGELRFLLVKINPIVEKYGKQVYKLGDPDAFYIGDSVTFSDLDNNRVDFTVRMQDFDRVEFDKLSEEYCCNLIEGIKKAHTKQNEQIMHHDNRDSKFRTQIFTPLKEDDIWDIVTLVTNVAIKGAKEYLEFEYSFSPPMHDFRKISSKIGEDSEEWKEYYQGIPKIVGEMNQKINSLITSL